MKILTIIPARGGSKGVPRKNLREVGGQPLIVWSIRAAKASKAVGELYVSTDDDEIAAVARECGVNVLRRPDALSGDRTPMIEVVRHALLECEERLGVAYDYFLLLQPTAPMRTAQDIDAAIGVLIESAADSVVSVYQVEDAHPARMFIIENDGLLPFCEEPAGSLRQDLPKVYLRNGAIYGCKRGLIKNEGILWGGKVSPYVMTKDRSANIDDMQDLLIADYLMRLSNLT